MSSTLNRTRKLRLVPIRQPVDNCVDASPNWPSYPQAGVKTQENAKSAEDRKVSRA
ncbi:MAG: hypothetical protein ACTIKY_01750 [Corynebacterium casei]|uniref:hypothetical protein n=1 Tax=Corynebacterium casei TaxID=160386 RepID=UPI0012DE1662|nr:hypothetical protein [Corynebacterium casei]